MNQISVLRTAAVASLSILIAVRVAQIHHTPQAAAQPHGRYTLDQILQRSLPLCGALTTNHEPLSLAGSPLITWELSRRIPAWIVDGVDAQDRSKVHLVWDADTGKWRFASRCADSVKSVKTGTLLNRSEAL